ncbi:hypothetical protein [Streptomyces sp. BBFR102]|uniref:hypothetical protein n=1 Tax=Streptomyces sp. BBFR102 TaxID=3448171 RepID=UPI003F53E3DF
MPSSRSFVTVGTAARHGHRIVFRKFGTYGLVVTALSIAVAALSVRPRYLVLGRTA